MTLCGGSYASLGNVAFIKGLCVNATEILYLSESIVVSINAVVPASSYVLNPVNIFNQIEK